MSEVLPSWNEGRARQSILDFVARVTDEGGADHVPPDARIVVFDNDGTLRCEKPVPIEMGFQLAAVDPSLRERQPWKAVVEGDHAWMAGVIIQALQRRRQRPEADGRRTAVGLFRRQRAGIRAQGRNSGEPLGGAPILENGPCST